MRDTIAHYKIISTIGAGGMGEVYLAHDSKLERQVALKLLPEEFTKDADRLHRFEKEAKAASALNHPNIITIYEIGQTDDSHYIATEYIAGETLRTKTKEKHLDLVETLNISIQVAEALAAAHLAGIIHRDIKPENIMVRPDGYVKVLDFGLAKLLDKGRPNVSADLEETTAIWTDTEPGKVMGTAAYMSPEQARGKDIDARSDIFSFGILLYEMVAGRNPFPGETPSDILVALISKEVVPVARYAPDTPADLQHIIGKALRKDRDERYQSMKSMLADMKELRREHEFQLKIERSASPDSAFDVTDQPTKNATAMLGVPSSDGSLAGPTVPRKGGTQSLSSAEYIVSGIKAHKRGIIAAVAAVLLITVSASAYFLYFKQKFSPVLTEKDTILLADFDNTTGDAVFDGALKQALAIQLEQSPFLNIFPDQRVRETLRLMGHSPDERVTKDVAREICQRQGLKAYLSGSISSLGSHLVITLEAVNAQTGDTLARQQVEAESKEQVLSALGQAATKLREKLGESLASIQKYDAPIEVATTSSLEAFKAYSMGRELHYKGKEADAIPLIRRAIELDPNFARAYDGLAHAHNNLGQLQLAREAMQKAFDLRERTSEYEKLKIAADYYDIVTGDEEKAIEALEMVVRIYPRDYMARNSLASRSNAVGRYERAIEEAREAVRLNPNAVFAYFQLALALRSLNRFDEAREVYEQGLGQNPDRTNYRANLYTIAFVQGDTAVMQQQLDWARGKPNEYVALFWQANMAGFLGQLRRARELNQRGADAELSRNLKEAAAGTISSNASETAVTGNCQQAREDVARASAFPRTASSFFGIGIALALCGELGQAQSLADDYAKQYPKDTLVNAVWLPAIRAAIEIRRNNPAQAIQFLQSASRYDRTGVYWPEYLRGQAYLAQGAGAEAAAEFQKILDRRGLAPTSVLYPLAQLGKARATKNKEEYEKFFEMWKDADPDMPAFAAAREEAGVLKNA